jgi:hypothetical protein
MSSKIELDSKIWTPLSIKIDLGNCLSRKVLFEKFDPEKSKIIEMTDFFLEKMNGCELFKHKNYPDFIFYIKNDGGKNEILFEDDEKNKILQVSYPSVWKVFKNRFGIGYVDIQTFVKDRFEILTKLKGYKTTGDSFIRIVV